MESRIDTMSYNMEGAEIKHITILLADIAIQMGTLNIPGVDSYWRSLPLLPAPPANTRENYPYLIQSYKSSLDNKGGGLATPTIFFL